MNQKSNGLALGDEKLVDLVNKDTDGDSIPDWEESLWGTDPSKKETTPGMPDASAIDKLKSQGENSGANSAADDKNLTKTDKFSREFFATVTALNQNGAIDQTTVDKLSNSLAENIQNSVPKKVYTLNDIKIGTSDTPENIKKYDNSLTLIFPTTSTGDTVFTILQKFTADENNVDPSVLNKLDPIIKNTQGYINGMLKMSVPPSLASAHLNVVNGFERIVENLQDIKLYDTDVVVALGAMTKYQENANTLTLADQKLGAVLSQKLSN